MVVISVNAGLGGPAHGTARTTHRLLCTRTNLHGLDPFAKLSKLLMHRVLDRAPRRALASSGLANSLPGRALTNRLLPGDGLTSRALASSGLADSLPGRALTNRLLPGDGLSLGNRDVHVAEPRGNDLGLVSAFVYDARFQL